MSTENSIIAAITLDKFLPHRLRHFLSALLMSVIALLGSVYALGQFLGLYILSVGLYGVFEWLLFVFVVLFWLVFSLEAFYRYFYLNTEVDVFDGVVLASHSLSVGAGRAFAESKLGSKTLERVGVSPEVFLNAFSLANQLGSLGVRFSDWCAVLAKDSSLATALSGQGIDPIDFVDAGIWVLKNESDVRFKEKWWSRELLLQYSGFTDFLIYGQKWLLEQYGDNITKHPYLLGTEFPDWTGRRGDVEKIEASLSKGKDANVVLVGPPGVGKISILGHFATKTRRRFSNSYLNNKQVIILQYESILTQGKDRSGIESLLVRILNEAANVGDILLVIKDLPVFLDSLRAAGLDPASILDTYLRSAALNIIALSDNIRFYQVVERDASLMKLFDKIEAKEPSGPELVSVIQDHAVGYEKHLGAVFTVSAIKTIISAADRYMTEGVMPEKAVDLLDAVAIVVGQKRVPVVDKELVLEVVKQKTAIPVGAVDSKEQDTLLNLESYLDKRVVGQERAIAVISQAIRRARSGIQSAKRPLGSFLFLGPTGVGKTETAKALAQVFFGGEKDMLRLDMSEYSGEDGLNRLIGDMKTGQIGVLTEMLRTHPYGVLLLDEFEKASRQVHNLFLQILDEGAFSDMEGRRVNAKNMMFIATSNAASATLLDIVKSGDDLENHRQEIIDQVIKNNIFPPELLNRFDAVIFYRPLGDDQLRQIAQILLVDLAKRLKEQQINFVPTKQAEDILMAAGTDYQFGARPMRRAVQDQIEAVIAKKIISGELKAGDTFTL